ncbi:arsenite efflux transporter metallochaperone ArsD [Patulibacter medicamentivorans]|uniref:arsenite efflux transporter metallochaperone ArsD n=1 Tax=Patulibacter medicamentivorans TaxID=1097667 RepID=UPI00058BEF6B|nr:arsenite efflux transporter metallochaperone ArsD [Patulibacter medicamentivorans]
MKLEVFDPAMCCSTGVCGPGVDPQLARFAADLGWLQEQGVEVQRYNLAQQPQAFVASTAAKDALRQHGEQALPLLVLDGAPVSHGSYPDRDALARLTLAGLVPSGSALPIADEQAGGCGCGPGGC